MLGKQRLPSETESFSNKQMISGISSLHGTGLPSNINVPYKRVTYTVFRAPPISAFSQNNQVKIIPMTKG